MVDLHAAQINRLAGARVGDGGERVVSAANRAGVPSAAVEGLAEEVLQVQFAILSMVWPLA